MASLAYRSDIDGIRAIAVVLVIAHHFGVAAFQGGYVGVDVFFVISGFLITSLILADASRFSLVHFYERRARRILPALFIVIAATLVAATVLFIPSDLAAVAESTVAALFFMSNFLFQAQSGYFDAAAELKPLLHTWSLAIEEQFYIIHPLFLMLLLRARDKRVVVAGIAGVLVASLAVSVLTTSTDPTAAYYLLPARAWELAAGALLATGIFSAPRDAVVAALTSACGLALIVFAATTYSSQTAFPGIAAIAPVGGTVLLLWAGQTGSITTRILSWRPAVIIGLLSYSLYLWHWPILVFAVYANGGDLDGPQATAALLLVAGLSVLTYRYVERPARSAVLCSMHRIVALGSVAAVLLFTVATATYLTGGLPARLRPTSAAILNADSSLPRLPCVGKGLRLQSGSTICPRGAKNVTPSFVLVGDSHALAISRAFFRAAADAGQAGYQISSAGFCPLPGVYAVRQPEYSAPLPDFIELLQRQPSVTHVVVACFWEMRVSMARQFRKMEFRDADYDGTGRAYNRVSLRRGLERLFEAFPHHTFVLLEDVPTGAALDPVAAARLAHVWGMDGIEYRMGLSRAAYEEQLASYRPILQQAVMHGRAEVLPVVDALCDATRCPGWRNGKPIYKDDDHISDSGALLMTDVFRAALLPGSKPHAAADP